MLERAHKDLGTGMLKLQVVMPGWEVLVGDEWKPRELSVHFHYFSIELRVDRVWVRPLACLFLQERFQMTHASCRLCRCSLGKAGTPWIKDPQLLQRDTGDLNRWPDDTTRRGENDCRWQNQIRGSGSAWVTWLP